MNATATGLFFVATGRPCIGSRYTRERVLRIDTLAGTYEALNAEPDQWQAVLLRKPAPWRISNLIYAWACLVGAVALYVWSK